MSDENSVSTISTDLLAQIRKLIDYSRLRVAATVNSELTMLNWNIGGLLKQHLQIENRAAYGQQLVIRLSKDLTAQYGRRWSHQQLRHCLYVVETNPDQDIIYTLCRQLNWSQIRTLPPAGYAMAGSSYGVKTEIVDLYRFVRLSHH